MASYPSVT